MSKGGGGGGGWLNDVKLLGWCVYVPGLQARGGPKVRVVWGTSDKYLNDGPMYTWTDEVRASFDCMRKAGLWGSISFSTRWGNHPTFTLRSSCFGCFFKIFVV